MICTKSIRMMIAGIFLSFLSFVSLNIQIGLAAIHVDNVTEWKGSKLWYVLFDETQYDLRIFFTFCVAIFLVGTLLLFLGIFYKDKEK